MKKKKLFRILSPLIACLGVYSLFNISTTIASYINQFVVDDSQEAFIDSTTNNFICYPLVKEKESDPDIVSIGWAKEPEACTGTLTIPTIVTKLNGNETIKYTVKVIAESGFRFCNFSSINFASNNIEEIKSEAFYSCQNMSTFPMPEKCIHGIAPSTFMDCRNLVTVDMSNVNSYINSRVSETDFLANNPYNIGDHAFASCVKLKSFNFPTSLSEIGEAAFNKCESILSIFFPADNEVNTISIGKYAFADCSKLTVMHFETNVSYIDTYAFAQCNYLKIYYQGNPDNNADDLMNNFSSYFRKKHVATNLTDEIKDYVPIEYDVSEISMSDDHPGIVYIKQRGPIYYDGDKDGTSTLVLDSSTDFYITIFKWQTPSTTSSDYDETNAILTIPDEIDNIPVKRIATHAFYDNLGTNEPLNGVIFNESLVQICHEAFLKCDTLATIDFSNCELLQEIGHNAFLPTNENTSFTGTFSFPNSLVYIGNRAFKNYVAATGLQLFDSSITPQLQFIGFEAFANLGSTSTNYFGTIDLLLPYSLADGSVVATDRPSPSASGDAPDCAGCVGQEAFANCKLLKYVTMQYHNTSNLAPASTGGAGKVNNKRTSFGNRVFSNCTYLERFRSNKAISRIGSGVFEKCKKLKEVFLSTNLAASDVSGYFLWGYGEGNSIFFSNSDYDDVEFRDTVIYVDGNNAPGKSEQRKYINWNSDPKTFTNEYSMSSDTNTYIHGAGGWSRLDQTLGRQFVPTYFGVNFHPNNQVIKYINVNTGNVVATNELITDYSNIAAVINKNNEYIVTRCYASGLSSIDMTSWNPGADIVTIGSCAFATLSETDSISNPFPAQKIIIPSSISTIRDRAFYSNGTDGINIITYKNSGNEVIDTGNDPKTNICFLHENITRIEAFSFYNNDFEKVLLPDGLSMLGNTSFNCTASKVSSIQSIGTNNASSYYDFIDGGMYDKDSKVLLYHVDGTGALDLSSRDITGIGPRSLAGASYSTITLPGTVTTIYGGAFQANRNLTQVSGLTGLEYLAPTVDNSNSEAWNSDTNYDLFDLSPYDFSSIYGINWNISSFKDSTGNFGNRPFYFQWKATYGAFARCEELTTFNFSSCISTLKKIGYGAFEGCKKLETLTDGATVYTYYRYKTGLLYTNVDDMISNNELTYTSVTNGVLDLSDATNLTTIGRDAFTNCEKIKYVHLPLVYEDDESKSSQAKFYLGIDIDSRSSWYSNNGQMNNNKKIFEGTAASSTGGVILVGESGNFANSSGTYYYSGTSKVGNTIDQYDNVYYSTKRYPDGFLPTANTYYFVRGRSYYNNDVVAKLSGTSCKYWIQIGNQNEHKYLLFEEKADLKTYYEL
ncbi:MAG: leucine-rich repeat domain-containing protein [Bacilli bacterium]|nr:leucine-rich repeat domain-containing protein [Bacilli bacterium]